MVSNCVFICLPQCICLLGPPQVEELPQQVHVVLGEKFQITCTATNDQDAPRNLMFFWEAPRGVEYNYTTTDEDDRHTASTTLHISNITVEHNGEEYTCIASNGVGGRQRVDTIFTLIVEGTPPSNDGTLW